MTHVLPPVLRAPLETGMCSQGLEPLVQTLMPSVPQQRGRASFSVALSFPGPDFSAACQSSKASMHLPKTRGSLFLHTLTRKINELP